MPFGNCTQPSNVKAGGGSCPIRFQCAGCGFYRPDPSYLPALEQHIAGLRADRETALAIDAADYVPASLTAEIDAFTAVAEAMHRELSQTHPAQRTEIEQASRILRGPRRPHPAADPRSGPRHGDRMTAPGRAQAMLAARARASQGKRQRAMDAVQALEAAGTPVTATAVAAAARVFVWLTYADGVGITSRLLQRRQAEHQPGPGPVTPPRRGAPVTPGQPAHRPRHRPG